MPFTHNHHNTGKLCRSSYDASSSWRNEAVVTIHLTVSSSLELQMTQLEIQPSNRFPCFEFQVILWPNKESWSLYRRNEAITHALTFSLWSNQEWTFGVQCSLCDNVLKTAVITSPHFDFFFSVVIYFPSDCLLFPVKVICDAFNDAKWQSSDQRTYKCGVLKYDHLFPPENDCFSNCRLCFEILACSKLAPHYHGRVFFCSQTLLAFSLTFTRSSCKRILLFLKGK